MKIIVLYGPSGSKNSTTIEQVFDRFQSNKNGIFPIEFGFPNDFETIFQYKNKRIGIYSFGETQYRIKDAIERYATKCDILLIAYNTAFKQIPRQLFRAEQISVIKSTDTEDCETIVKKIEELI